jgi:hypothetical protein
VARDRLRRDRDDAEAIASRERSQHAAFIDAEHRASRRLAPHLRTGIAEARDYEGAGSVVLLHQPAQRQRDLLHILMAFDAERPFGERRAADRRAAHVGGGTTLVEARALGRESVGVDIGPLAEFVARVKSTVYSEAELETLATWAPSTISAARVQTSDVQIVCSEVG